jgi:hypothetical protein
MFKGKARVEIRMDDASGVVVMNKMFDMLYYIFLDICGYCKIPRVY